MLGGVLVDLVRMFDYAVERNPNEIAIVEGNNHYSYKEVKTMVNHVAASLYRLGIKKGDRIAILLRNRMEAIVLFWATQKVGAVFSPINIKQSTEIIHYCINDLDVKMIVSEKSTEYLIDRGKIDYRPIFISIDGEDDITYEELLQGNENDFSYVPIHEENLSIILYTSGTSGVPKGVPRTHLNEYSSTLAYVFHCHYERMDTSLGVISLHHTMGMRSLLSMFLLNGKLILLKEFDPHEACQLIQDQKVTSLYLLPSMYHEMVTLTNIRQYNFEQIRVISYAGAPMSSKLIQKCQEVFQPTYFINQYGSTEIFTHCICQDIMHKRGCVGKPGIHQKIKIIEADIQRIKSEEDAVPDGEIGEIIVHMGSPEAFKGYWNKLEITKKSVKNDWYYTGDLGYKDKSGDIYIVGRVDEMILHAGENIFPIEVENILLEHPEVKEVMIVGEEDERWGQVVVAYIVPNDELLTAEELDIFCKSHPSLSNYKRPRRYIFKSSLPKTISGKLFRKQVNF